MIRQKKRDKSHLIEIIIPLTVIICGTILCWVTDFDMDLSKRFYNPETYTWPANNNPFIYFTYRWGPYPTIFLFLGALIVTAATYLHPRHLQKRATSLFIVLCILIGPVVLVSGIGKETWRRPRPRYTVELGGYNQFQKVLTFGNREFRGESFPSGHASSAFALVLLYFLFKTHNRRLARLALLISLGWGGWMSYVRIAMGGHFFSDILYSFGLTWFVACFLYYNWYIPYREQIKERRKFAPSGQRYFVVGIIVVFIASVLAFRSFATKPFEMTYPTKTVSLSTPFNKAKVKVNIKSGHIIVKYGKSNEIGFSTRIRGNSVSKIDTVREFKLNDETPNWEISYTVEPSVYVFKYICFTTVTIPRNTPLELDLFTNKGTIYRYDLR